MEVTEAKQDSKGKTVVEPKLLVMIYPDGTAIDAEDVYVVLNELDKLGTEKASHIDLLLNSNGGNAYAAFKIINIIRSKCATLHVIVPDFAKSAATLMALGADTIVMGESSELGPLDKPMEHPLVEGIRMSALDGIRPLQDLALFSSTMAIEDVGRRIRNKVGLGRKESVELALHFMADYIDPVMAKLDPLLLNKSQRELIVAERLGLDLLNEFMWKGNPQRSVRIIKELVWSYPEHGFIINPREAKRIGLKITDAPRFGKWTEIWNLYKLYQGTEDKIIRLLSYEEIEKILTGNNDVKQIDSE